jgi:hypothetical protein
MSKVKANIKGGIGSLKPERKVRPKYSGWHLVFNLNVRYNDDDPNLKQDNEIFDGVIRDKVLNHLEVC